MIEERLRWLLSGDLPPGAYRLNSRKGARAIALAALEAGWRFYLIDLRNVRNKAAFMQTAAEALHLPAYFGRNWDAFEEVVNDLPRLAAIREPGEKSPRGHLVLLDRSSPLRYAAPDELGTVLDILQTAGESLRCERAPLVVLVRGAGPVARDLPLLG
jgi:hypothetical protein